MDFHVSFMTIPIKLDSLFATSIWLMPKNIFRKGRDCKTVSFFNVHSIYVAEHLYNIIATIERVDVVQLWILKTNVCSNV